MHVYLNLGFNPDGGSVGPELLHKIKSSGFRGIRQDVPEDHDHAWALLRELSTEDVIWLLAGGHMTRSDGQPWQPDALVDHVRDTCVKLREVGALSSAGDLALEIGNEPDNAHEFWKSQPQLLASTFRRCCEVVREFSAGVPILTPSVKNLKTDEPGLGLHYLEAMMATGEVPVDAHVAAHRYPPGLTHSQPHKGFSSRRAEVQALREIAGDRPIWITETGRTEGPQVIRSGLFGWRREEKWLTEEQVRDYAREELLFWGTAGVEAVVWYQLNDGDDRKNYLNTFGIRRSDGNWKPVATALPTIIADATARTSTARA